MTVFSVSRERPVYRTRKRPLIEPHFQLTYTIETYDGVGAGTFNSTMLPPINTGAIMHDVVVPNYESLRARGALIFNPMSSSITTTHGNPATITDTYNERPYGAWRATQTSTVWKSRNANSTLFPTVTPPSTPKELESEVVTLAFADAYNSAGQAFVDMLEAGDTLRMLADTFRRAVKLARRTVRYGPFPKGSRKFPKLHTRGSIRGLASGTGRAVTHTGNAWIEWRYGWQPLLLSIDEYLTAMQAVQATIRVFGRAAKTSASEASSIKTTTSSGWANCTLTTDGTVVVRNDYGCSAVAAVEIPMSVARAMGCSSDAIPSAAWEVVPFSFVVDWFVDVGSWIQAVCAPPGTKFLGSSLTTRSVITTRRVAKFHDASSWSGSSSSYSTRTRQGGSDTWTVVSTNKARRVDVRPPDLPPLKAGSLSLNHSLDAIALAIAQLRSIASVRR